VAIDGGSFLDRPVHVRDRHHDANATAHSLGYLGLIEITRSVVVDRGPKELAQILNVAGGGRDGPRFDRVELLLSTPREIRIEAVVDHLLFGGSDEIEMITHFAVKGTEAIVFSQAS
jgi:hypothetical protein